MITQSCKEGFSLRKYLKNKFGAQKMQWKIFQGCSGFFKFWHVVFPHLSDTDHVYKNHFQTWQCQKWLKGDWQPSPIGAATLWYSSAEILRGQVSSQRTLQGKGTEVPSPRVGPQQSLWATWICASSVAGTERRRPVLGSKAWGGEIEFNDSPGCCPAPS